MTTDQLKALRDGITPGPWYFDPHTREVDSDHGVIADAYRPVEHNGRAMAMLPTLLDRCISQQTLLNKIMAYRIGRGEYDLSNLPESVRAIACMEAWEAIEDELREATSQGEQDAG